MNKVQFLIASDIDANVKNSIVEMLNAQEILDNFEIVEDFELRNASEKLKQISDTSDITPILVGCPTPDVGRKILDRIHSDIILAHSPKINIPLIHLHHELLEDPSIGLNDISISHKLDVLGDIHYKLDGKLPHESFFLHAHRDYLEDFNIDTFKDNLNGHANMDRKMHLTDNVYGGSISHNQSRWENKKSQKTMILKGKRHKKRK